MTANHLLGQLGALFGQRDLGPSHRQKPFVGHFVHHFRHCRPRDVEAFGDACLNDRHVVLAKLEDGLAILLERRVILVESGVASARRLHITTIGRPGPVGSPLRRRYCGANGGQPTCHSSPGCPGRRALVRGAGRSPRFGLSPLFLHQGNRARGRLALRPPPTQTWHGTTGCRLRTRAPQPRVCQAWHRGHRGGHLGALRAVGQLRSA